MPKNLKSIQNLTNNIPMPSSINYNWNLGSLLGMTLTLQIITGMMISFHYKTSMQEAFQSVMNISRNINNGWLIRIIHINGASLFFVLLYYHISKNMLMKSFKMKTTWNSGVIIILMLMSTAFMGYILPWGQMSFWAATVITNLLSAIPIWGNTMVNWIWGGFSVSEPTLIRFFSLHFLTPFIIAMMTVIHMMMLHSKGSSNPINISMQKDKINFHPFFTSKDLVGSILTLSMMMTLISMYPYMSTDPENFMPANPMVTPTHIQPEWYFLFAYAILRSIPNKLGGVMALAMSIMILMLKTLQNQKKSSFKFNKKSTTAFMMLTHTFMILTWIGMKQVEQPFLTIGYIYSMMYFSIMMAI